MSRMIRIESLLKQQISLIIQKDFRSNLGLISIIGIRLSKDLSNATIIYSHMGSPTEQKKSLQKLQKARQLIKKERGKTIRLKRIPSLTFKLNDALEKGSNIVNQIKTL